jgi:O-antigen ligase
MNRLPAPSFWIGCLCFFLAVTLQIQATFLYNYETYKGIRFCLADIALPFVGLAIAFSLIRRKSAWPQWRVPHTYLWLGGLFLVLAAALMQTHSLYGVWSYWGITNKLPGMVVMASYFCLGGWIAQNASIDNLLLFFCLLFGFFITVMGIELAGLLWQDFYHYADYINLWPNFPLQGLMDNRNVYALLALVLFSLLICLSAEGIKILPRPLVYTVAGLMPLFLFEIGSRASFIAAIAMLVLLIILLKKKVVPFLLSLCVGAMLFTALYFKTPEKLLLIHYDQLDIVDHVQDLSNRTENIEDVSKTLTYQGDNFRLQILKISKNMIMERPISGSGLGSSFIVQKELRGGRYDIIENTPLWLWVETGLFGLITFGAFYILCVRGLITGMKANGLTGTLNKAMIVSLAVFTVMTCLHELMFTRQIWFLMGMALALPLVPRVKTHPA